MRIFPNRQFERFEFQGRLRQLQAAFPGATAYHRVSRPGFDSARNLAIVYLAMSCEGVCGRGGVVVLQRRGSGWAVRGFVDMGTRGVTRSE